MVKRIAVAVALFGAVALFRPGPAEAHFSFSLWLPGLAVAAGPAYPPPVVYAPAYYPPPPPVVYVPQPYYPVPVVYGGWHHGRGSHHHRGHGWSKHGRRW